MQLCALAAKYDWTRWKRWICDHLSSNISVSAQMILLELETLRSCLWMVGPDSLIMALALDLCIMKKHKAAQPQVPAKGNENSISSFLHTSLSRLGMTRQVPRILRPIFLRLYGTFPTLELGSATGISNNREPSLEVPKDCKSLGWAKTP